MLLMFMPAIAGICEPYNCPAVGVMSVSILAVAAAAAVAAVAAAAAAVVTAAAAAGVDFVVVGVVTLRRTMIVTFL